MMIGLIAILMIQRRLVAGTVAILGTVALMVVIRDRLRVAYLATQFEPIYNKRHKCCFIVIASHQRARGNLAAFGIASVTAFLRNDTPFNAFVLVWRPALTGGLCPLCAGRASKCRHDRLDALEVSTAPNFRSTMRVPSENSRENQRVAYHSLESW